MLGLRYKRNIFLGKDCIFGMRQNHLYTHTHIHAAEIWKINICYVRITVRFRKFSECLLANSSFGKSGRSQWQLPSWQPTKRYNFLNKWTNEWHIKGTCISSLLCYLSAWRAKILAAVLGSCWLLNRKKIEKSNLLNGMRQL